MAKLLRKANDISSTVSPSGFPVLARNIVTACQVSGVIFKPLRVDGGLNLTPEGFKIYVNSDEKFYCHDQELFLTERLGYTLSSRQRFTIAHELAHTLFYEIPTAGVPRLSSFAKGKANLDRIEVACNSIAASLLLPHKLLDQELFRLDIFNPNHLRILATRAAVSDKALAIRIAPRLLDGAIICCEKQLNNFNIGSIHASIAMAHSFPPAVCSTAFEAQFPQSNLVVAGGSLVKTNYEIRMPGPTRLVIPVELRCESLSGSEQKKVFVTIRHVGSPFYK